MTTSRRHVALGGWIAALFVVGVVGTRYLQPRIMSPTLDELSRPYTPPQDPRQRGAPELLFVYLTSPTCQICADPRLPMALDSMKLRMMTLAMDRDIRFSAVGVAIDPIPLRGVRHLAALGVWDEVIAGRGWANTGAMRYIWQDYPGHPSVPQLVVLKRRMRAYPHPIWDVLAEDVVFRRIGVKSILAVTGELPRVLDLES